MGVLRLFLILVCVYGFGQVTPANASFLKLGAGANSCAKFLEYMNQDQDSTRELVLKHFSEWTAGYFTALNAERNLSKGKGVDMRGVVLEIQIACKQNPISTYLVEAFRVYVEKL